MLHGDIRPSRGPKQLPKLLSSLYRVDVNGDLHDVMLQDETTPAYPLAVDYSLQQDQEDGTASPDHEEEVSRVVDTPIPKPDNITVTLFSWTPPSIRVGWDFDGLLPDDATATPTTSYFYPVPPEASTQAPIKEAAGRKEHADLKSRLEAFRIIYHPTITKFRIIREVPPTFRNITIESLEPQTEYFLTIIALFQSPIKSDLPPLVDPSEIQYSSSTSEPAVPVNYHKLWANDSSSGASSQKPVTQSSSDVIRFVSPDSEPGRFNRHSYRSLVRRPHQVPGEVTVKTDELVIVILVLCIWITVIAIFIKKWGKIRAIEPCQSYYSPEIYDIPLKKSMGLSSDGGMSPVGAGQPSFDNNGCPSHLMTSTESRRSLSAASRRESYPAYVMTSTMPYGFPSGTYPSQFANSSSNAPYLNPHGQRQRLNSVFVTPPTRPPTPLPGDSSPRRFKSAEDLRSIVNEFTRRKSTLLLPPSYFQRHAMSTHHHA